MRRPFSQAFLTGEPEATAFLPRSFAEPATRLAQVRRAALRGCDSRVVAAVTAQNRRYPATTVRDENLAALGQPGATVMVTGQQTGLFLGPLYSFYKAAAVIADARAIERETGTRCVPVFWLQSEDHDFEEINRCTVIDREGQLLTLRLDDGPPTSSRVSVKHVVLGPSVVAQCERLRAAVGDGPFFEMIQRHYQPGVGVVDAFAGLMAEVFSSEGLVLIDPRDEALAQVLVPGHERALREASSISTALMARASALEAAGFATQVHLRPGAPLSFFHAQGPTGPRARLEASAVASHQVREAPLCFSSSALLRPVLQDSMLPTVGYVGGPGELNYFAQLQPLYDAFELPMPMFVPRARFRLVDPRTKARMNKATTPVDGGALAPEAIRGELMRVVNQVLDSVPLEPMLTSAMTRTRGTIERAASRFALRYERVLASREQTAHERSKRVEAVLLPRGEPQERVLGLPTFACPMGLERVKTAVFAALVPFDPDLKDVFL